MSARAARQAFAVRPVSRPSGIPAAMARVRALRLVAPVRARARRTPFVVVVVSLLSIGLVGLIVISTTLQDQAFKLAELQRESTSLKIEQQRISRQVDALDSPGSVAQKAISLGMVPNANPVFLRPSDGEVIGQPVPAQPKSNVKRVDQ